MTDLTNAGTVTGNVRWLLRLEGLAQFTVMTVLYAVWGGSWWVYALLFLAPDLSMLGYLAGPRVGAWAYNLFHTYALPGALACICFIYEHQLGLSVAMIWMAHIGFDRALGYGLKYSSGFGSTHLGRIGKPQPVAAAPATAESSN